MNSIRTILLLGLAIVLASLWGCSEQPEQGADEIRQKIAQYTSEVNELNRKISLLKKELADNHGQVLPGANELPVVVSEVGLSLFEQYFRATATVEAIQTATISPEASGQIQKILVEKGQRVNSGQVVAMLNTSVIISNIEEIKTSLQLARTVYMRQRGLWEQQIGSELQYLEAKNAVESLETRLGTLESQKEMAVLRAPFAGIVDELFQKEGELAMPGLALMNIINLNKLYVNADVSEAHLARISKGDMVQLRFPAFPGSEQQVPVHRVGHVINPENRTFRVQLIIDNPQETYKPNMMASMSIRVNTFPDVVVIPSIFIRQDIQGHYVYLAKEANGRYISSKRYIERGLDGEGNTLVLSGLYPGDLLITRGHNQVIDGGSIRFDNHTTAYRAE